MEKENEPIEKIKNNKSAVISLCFGVASVIFWEFSLIPILAIVFGVVGLIRDKKKWLAGIGIALGIIFLVVRIGHGSINGGIFSNLSLSNKAEQTTVVQPPLISNPDYLKNPSAYLVDYDNKISAQIPTNKPLWVEAVINSSALKVSYSVIRAEKNIMVLNGIHIPGLDFSGEVGSCMDNVSIDFLNKNLLHTEVYLVSERNKKWKLLMPASNAKDTVDISLFILQNGYGKRSLFEFESDHSNPKELDDYQAVARLEGRGFWGMCK